jgi:uncharacterized protein (DUF934 family)
MPTLIKEGTVSSDQWFTGTAPMLAPEAWRQQPGSALLLQVDSEPEEDFAKAPLIAIEFPEFKDGRGLSLGSLLRSRFGFRGDLRAVGDVHPDLVHYLIRCGFSSFVLPDGRDVAVALRGTQVYSHYYQGSVRDPQPLYRRVRR